MKSMILDQSTRLYEPTDRRPEARAYSKGELVRFTERDGDIQAGAVLRLESVHSDGKYVRLRRRSGAIVEWSPTSSVQVFAPTTEEVKRETVLEWSADRAELGAQAGDLGIVSDVHPRRGVTVRSHKLGELKLDLETGAWHYEVTREGIIGHLRQVGERRLEPYRDVDPAPEKPTHKRPFDELARPYSLLTHGRPPPLELVSRGDLVYFAASRDDRIPENHIYRIGEVREDRVRLIDGRELSAEPQIARDIWWRPTSKEEVRLYTPASSIASQDLIAWKRDDAKLLVRRGTYAEVLEVQPGGIVVSGVTSTPELLRVDRERWAPRWHGENGSWHLTQVGGRERKRDLERSTGVAQLALGLGG